MVEPVLLRKFNILIVSEPLLTKYGHVGSEDMSLVQLYFASESARAIVYALGNIGQLDFRDLNPNVSVFQRAFTAEIRNLDVVARKIRTIISYVEEASIPIATLPDQIIHYTAIPANVLDDLSRDIAHHEERLTDARGNISSLQTQYINLLEERHVVLHVNQFFLKAFESPDYENESADDSTPLLTLDSDKQGHHSMQKRGTMQQEARISAEIGPGDGPDGGSEEGSQRRVTPWSSERSSQPGKYQSFQQSEASAHPLMLDLIAGIITKEDAAMLERTLWRTFRGNLLIRQRDVEISKLHQDTPILKTTFIILAHGSVMKDKIRKLCQALGARLFNVQGDYNARRQDLLDLNSQITEMTTVIDNSLDAFQADLRYLAENILTWEAYYKKEKSIYHVMNMFSYDQNRKTLVAEAWCPSKALLTVQDVMRDSASREGSQTPAVLNAIPSKISPPTYHKTNKFTAAFQSIIDSYGMATYLELNPGIFSIVTFPFLFAVMFGDLGHGFVLLIAALYMIVNERRLVKKKGEIFEMMFYGRYIMLMMGLFSIYTGLIYNDVFSRSMKLFKSGWDIAKDGTSRQHGVYAFGLDYAWHGADNALLFINSIKMKMSIIMGVAHMTFSLWLSYFNYRFFKRRLDIITLFLPSILFLECLFGYLALIIMYKWMVDWSKAGMSPPALLNTFINMFLSPGKIDGQLYRGQKFVQILLLLTALVCVPWMLLSKPLYLRYEAQQAQRRGYEGLTQNLNGDSEMEEVEKFDFGEVLMHQVIHTIEFCLGCISHTASYLRLWALSLAHSQLSEVLWNMTLGIGLRYQGVLRIPLLILISSFWLALTLAVLVSMEGVSAMLHSLRLHWVEAMSKHYFGEGYGFSPFSFSTILNSSSD